LPLSSSHLSSFTGTSLVLLGVHFVCNSLLLFGGGPLCHFAGAYLPPSTLTQVLGCSPGPFHCTPSSSIGFCIWHFPGFGWYILIDIPFPRVGILMGTDLLPPTSLPPYLAHFDTTRPGVEHSTTWVQTFLVGGAALSLHTEHSYKGAYTCTWVPQTWAIHTCTAPAQIKIPGWTQVEPQNLGFHRQVLGMHCFSLSPTHYSLGTFLHIFSSTSLTWDSKTLPLGT